jgi:hypothetical protein
VKGSNCNAVAFHLRKWLENQELGMAETATIRLKSALRPPLGRNSLEPLSSLAYLIAR